MAIEVPAGKIFITPADLRKRYGDFDPAIFTRWQEEGKVDKIRDGLYLSGEFELRGDLDRFVIAEELYSPSYISLHSALRYYNFIPETVYQVISVTADKSVDFNYRNANYKYHHINSEAFFGYTSIEWRGGSYHMASPEKALLDLAWFEPQFADPEWLDEMRFDVDEMNEQLDWTTMLLYGEQMQSKEMMLRITSFLDVYYP
ncbi:MAG: hypothetical protein WBA17_09150 [Saprospiraceae bacterium]